MDALLILSGIVLLAIGWVWLVIGSLRLRTGRLVVAIFLPVFTLVRRGQGYPRAPRLVLAVGCIAVLAGLAMLFHLHPHRFGRLVTGQWHVEHARAQGISGEIMGQRFRPDRVYWRGDDLVLEEGPVERVRRSLTIRFDGTSHLIDGNRVALLPTDTGRWPELLLQWHAGALESPGLRRIAAQYSLNLDLLPSERSGARIRLHLALPSQHQTWVSGEAVLEQLDIDRMELEVHLVRAVRFGEHDATVVGNAFETPLVGAARDGGDAYRGVSQHARFIDDGQHTDRLPAGRCRLRGFA